MQYQDTLETRTIHAANGQSHRYIPAVDGLRALGVLTVLFYHLRLPFAKSGLLGVTVFFVLSGYLVTRLLLSEADATGTINLKEFLRRRGRRIMPVMILMILVMSIVYTFTDGFLLNKMRPDVVPSILIFNNWWQLLQNVSYFEAQGAPSPLTHYWSLAIEGQFYLIWPFIILLFVKLRRASRVHGGDGRGWTALAVATAVLAVISAVLLVVYFDPTADSSRAYYGTDSRCFSLLAGALLAMWETDGGMQRMAGRSVFAAKGGRTGRFSATDIAGGISLLVILLIIWLVRGSSPLLYRGGQQLVTVLTMILLYAALQEDSLWSRFWAWKPFVAIGKISYSIYIWHYPVIDLISGVRRASFGTTMLEIALSFGLAAAGYFLVETPCRRGALGRMAADIRTWISVRKARKEGYDAEGTGIGAKNAATIIVTAVLILASVFCLLFGGSFAKSRHPVPPVAHRSEMLIREYEQKVRNEQALQAAAEQAAAEEQQQQYDYLLIGDSVALTAAKDLNARFPNMIVDAVNSRMSYETAGILDSYLQKGWDGKAVIFALSTNGPITDELETIREKIGPDKQIFIINARAPYDEFPDRNNKIIKTFVDSDPNAYLIDWYSESNAHENWFDGDGTHMNPEGNVHYVDLIDKVLTSVYGEETHRDPNAESGE